VWDLTSIGRSHLMGRIPYPPSSFGPTRAVSPRGDVVAWASPSTSTIELTALPSGATVGSIPYTVTAVGPLMYFTPDGSELFIDTLSYDPSFTIRYNLDQRRLLAPLPGTFVSISANGRYAATSVMNFDELLVFDLDSDAEIARFNPPDAVFPGDAVISPDGTVVVIHNQVFDLQTKRLRATLPFSFGSFIDQLLFSPSGDRLYHVNGFAGTVTLDLIDSITFETRARHQFSIEEGGFWSPAMLVSRDGAHLWLHGKLLDARTLAQLARPGDLVGREPGPSTVTFSSSGDALYIAVGDRVHQLLTSPSVLAARACELVGRNLTAAERDLLGTSTTPACPQWPNEP
jgi:DNA-binding beta-propeller fold protein YncE